jgi:hypothetical protein
MKEGGIAERFLEFAARVVEITAKPLASSEFLRIAVFHSPFPVLCSPVFLISGLSVRQFDSTSGNTEGLPHPDFPGALAPDFAIPLWNSQLRAIQARRARIGICRRDVSARLKTPPPFV